MQIYIAEGTQQTGPFDLDTIKAGLSAGRYQPTQLAWYEGAAGWEPINKLPGMETAAAAPPPMPMPSTPPMPPAYPSAPPAPYPSAPPAPYSSAPPPPYGTAQPPPAPYGSVPPAPYGTRSTPPSKTSWWGKIGSILVGLIVILGGLARISRVFYSGSSGSSSYHSSSTPAVTTKTYDNDAAQFTSGERQKYYINFRLGYPSSWELASGAKANNEVDFVQINRPYNQKYVESVAVEDFYGNGPSLAQQLPALAPKYMASVLANGQKGSTNYEKVSEGTTSCNGYAAYDYRARYSNTNKAGETFKVWVRFIIVAPPTGQNGVILKFTANSFSPDVTNTDDLGTKGDMAKMLQSFRFQ